MDRWIQERDISGFHHDNPGGILRTVSQSGSDYESTLVIMRYKHIVYFYFPVPPDSGIMEWLPENLCDGSDLIILRGIPDSLYCVKETAGK